jgi:hypothetical protein
MRARLGPLARLTVIAIMIGVAIGGLFAYTSRASAEPATSIEYAQYRNDRWHFTIAVPADMTFAEYDGPGDSQTIQFSDASAHKIFEVSAEPYTQMDVALGEEGAPNASSDQSTTLGIINVYHQDTVAYSFHRNGIAYTVTTLPGSEAWLLPILQSWEFTDK